MEEAKGKGRRGVLAVAVVALLAAAPAAGVEPVLASIGTGDKSGVYYLAGGAICGFVDAERWTTGIRCLAESTDGSIDNLRAVRNGTRTFGLVQSDWQHHAFYGTDVFRQAGPDRDLRSVVSLFREPFTVVARPDAGIGGIADLKGKRVNLGPSGSGGRATMRVVMDAMGWTDESFAYVDDLAMADVPRALCAGEIDAAVAIVAHPNQSVEEMMRSCNAVLVPVNGPGIERMMDENTFYAPGEVSAGTYDGQTASVPSFAVTATLVTSSRTSPAVVYEVTKALFQNFDAFRAAHPAFADIEKERMFSEGLTAPLHDGALRYLPEAKLR
ncbi:MAG: TAXI family TRAP transporter solute-binding subunit [Amaricoccus sp.]